MWLWFIRLCWTKQIKFDIWIISHSDIDFVISLVLNLKDIISSLQFWISLKYQFDSWEGSKSHSLKLLDYQWSCLILPILAREEHMSPFMRALTSVITKDLDTWPGTCVRTQEILFIYILSKLPLNFFISKMILLTIEIFPKMRSKFHQLDIGWDSLEKKNRFYWTNKFGEQSIKQS